MKTLDTIVSEAVCDYTKACATSGKKLDVKSFLRGYLAVLRRCQPVPIASDVFLAAVSGELKTAKAEGSVQP